jgi:RND family efflux transporter MFP subunit
MIDSLLIFFRNSATWLFVSTLLVGIVSCSSEKDQTSQAEQFPVTNPALMDTVFAREYVAEIQSIQNVELRARVKGFIEKIHVDEGQHVQAGQVLFTISSQEFREELMKANALLKSAVAESKVAEVELKNTKTLVEKKIVSTTELELAEAKFEAIQAKIDEAKSAISSAQLNLSFASVKAPFGGTLNRIPNKAGSLIEEGALLTTISNNKEVFAYFYVSEREYLDFVRQNELGKDKSVSLVMADNQTHKFKGRIETTESEIDKNTGTIGFRARFANPDQLLKHGSTAKVILNSELKNAIVIPQKSTFEIQENTYVYVVDKDNVVRMRSIVPKLRMSNVYVLESGLSSTDQIIYEGIQRVREGDKVIPDLVSFRPVIAQVVNQ